MFSEQIWAERIGILRCQFVVSEKALAKFARIAVTIVIARITISFTAVKLKIGFVVIVIAASK